MNSLVQQAYGDALFQISVKYDLSQVFYEDIQVLKQVITNQLLTLLKNPHFAKKEKIVMIDEIFDTLHPFVKNFLKIVITKNSANELNGIFDVFENKYFDHHHIQPIFVTSATVLNEVQQAKIKETFEKKLNKKVKMHIKLDSNLIAGLIVQVNDEVYDNSLTTKLAHLKQSV